LPTPQPMIQSPPVLANISRILPHRYPFLLIDRITEFVPATRIAGIKTFTANEFYQPGHFPGEPIVPCAILLEMTTQLGAVLVLERPEASGKIAMILHIPSARMYSCARPGDVLRAEARVLRLRAHSGELQGIVLRGEELVAEGQMRFAIADPGLALRDSVFAPRE
ncbi:MAG: 3-hydroxyacyl-ACP dehydratase FabZ family protein, partial [Terriglobia bacterium]